MNLVDPLNVMPWSSDWLWSLPLSVLTVVLHVFGLFVIRRRFDRMLVHVEQSRMRSFAALFLAGATVSVTLLHGTEAAVWALAFRLLHALPDPRSATLFSLNAMTTYGQSGTNLERHWLMMGALEALNGWILFGLSTAFLYAMIQDAWVHLGQMPSKPRLA
jgi:hypothetical protein